MKRRSLAAQGLGLAGVLLLLLVGCAASGNVTPGPDPEATSPGQPSATPTSCVGWSCTLQGVVYADPLRPGNELPGALVRLSQVSYCSPTAGKHETRTGLDGAFRFEVYLHDTDTFWFEVEEEGYEPARVSMGGFDCLYCSCPPVEIVLNSR